MPNLSPINPVQLERQPVGNHLQNFVQAPVLNPFSVSVQSEPEENLLHVQPMSSSSTPSLQKGKRKSSASTHRVKATISNGANSNKTGLENRENASILSRNQFFGTYDPRKQNQHERVVAYYLEHPGNSISDYRNDNNNSADAELVPLEVLDILKEYGLGTRDLRKNASQSVGGSKKKSSAQNGEGAHTRKKPKNIK